MFTHVSMTFFFYTQIIPPRLRKERRGDRLRELNRDAFSTFFSNVFFIKGNQSVLVVSMAAFFICIAHIQKKPLVKEIIGTLVTK